MLFQGRWKQCALLSVFAAVAMACGVLVIIEACAAPPAETAVQPAAKEEPRSIKLTVTNSHRAGNQASDPPGARSFVVPGWCNAMATATIQVKIEANVADGTAVVWKIENGPGFAATPSSGVGLRADVTLTPPTSPRDPSKTHDYTVKAGFDDNGNGMLDAGEVKCRVPIHYVTMSEYNAGYQYCFLQPYCLGWPFPAAHDNMARFLALPGDGDFSAYSDQEFAYASGYFDMPGLGSTDVDGDKCSMRVFDFATTSAHAICVQDRSEYLGEIQRAVTEKADVIRQYFRDNPSESSHVFDTSTFKTSRTLRFVGGDAGWSLGTCAATFDTFNITISLMPDGRLGIGQAQVQGYIKDVYDWDPGVDERPACVQAGYEPACGRNIGKPFGERIRMQNTYDGSKFPGYGL